jgi:uncharacterized repeat protein (TIGR03803 family)
MASFSRQSKQPIEFSHLVSRPMMQWVLAASATLALMVAPLPRGFTSPVAQAQTLTTVYSFAGPPDDGDEPWAGVIQDSSGNLYGTTYGGGITSCTGDYPPFGCGIVFKIDTTGAETVLHRFTGGTTDGEYSFAPLLRDQNGNLYGTAVSGGSANCGVIFKIDTAGTETVLYNFLGGTTDGCSPEQGLVEDEAGNLYGTTAGGGNASCYEGCGTVFKLSPDGTEVLLHSFTGVDGVLPAYGSLLRDAEGNLYGLTTGGDDTKSAGSLYKLTSQGKLTVLHAFCDGNNDGCFPMGTPAVDKEGNIYGITSEGGDLDDGTLWRVSKQGVETILYNFGGDAVYPEAGVVLDSSGNIYGNSTVGGAYYGGTLWEMSKDLTFSVLYNFPAGSYVLGEMLIDPSGRLYGTSASAGFYKYGSVWSYQ